MFFVEPNLSGTADAYLHPLNKNEKCRFSCVSRFYRNKALKVFSSTYISKLCKLA